MYGLYVDHCILMNKRVSSKSFFDKVFHKNFNLKFLNKTKKKCHRCLDHVTNVDSEIEKTQTQEAKQIHIDIVKQIKNDFVETIETVSKDTRVYTFQLCTPQELPFLTQDESAFHRPLWFFILLIFDGIERETFAYVWNESIGSHGTHEIVSCLHKHLLSNVTKDVKKVILYCDPRGGQNRNIEFSLMLKEMINDEKISNLEVIEQRFFASGHTFNSCDRSFKVIEDQKKKTKEIFSHEKWVDVVSKCKINKTEFNVTEMTEKDFELSTPNIESRKKIKWSMVKAIKYDKNNSQMEVMLCISQTYEKVYLQEKENNTEYKNKKISKQKYDDLQNLLNCIPEKHHNFYKNLKFSFENNLDYALAVGQYLPFII